MQLGFQKERRERIEGKIMAENFPKEAKIKPQIVEASGSPQRINTKKISPWHIIVKLPKPKDKESSL